jgi:hypothetical protein
VPVVVVAMLLMNASDVPNKYMRDDDVSNTQNIDFEFHSLFIIVWVNIDGEKVAGARGGPQSWAKS